MVEHLIIADGTRRERSNELVDRLNLARGERWHIAVPCGVGPGLDPAVRTAGINDLDGALDALDHVADGATLAIEGVDYWCMGPAEPMENPDNNPDLARWNAIMRRSTHVRVRFRMKLAGLLEREPSTRLMLTASSLDAAQRLLGQYPLGFPFVACRRVDLSKGVEYAPGRR